MSYIPPKSWEIPLAAKFLNLDDDERAFFKASTSIDDDDELDEHILDVQSKAYEIFPYPCIRIFGFTRIRISRLPAYADFLKLGRDRTNPIFIDLGCACASSLGSDVRKAVLDGYPIQSCLATDLRGGLWQQGHALFKSTPESFPVPFIEGDVFDRAFLDVVPPFSADAPPLGPPPALEAVTSLNPLRGHVSAVFMGKFLHLFDEAGQAHLARALAGLLSPEPGSILFGVQGAQPERGPFTPTSSDWTMFCHSLESWKELWEGVFGPGKVKVETRMVTEPGGPSYFDTWPGNTKPFTCQEWSVTRLTPWEQALDVGVREMCYVEGVGPVGVFSGSIDRMYVHIYLSSLTYRVGVVQIVRGFSPGRLLELDAVMGRVGMVSLR
ncbi:hypothetical protein OF83DRAFT_1050413 [Amylostereum chailletii]|nr:hypothetical protein OF83DRAFT_1050413 [Amylostereum chailletii]